MHIPAHISGIKSVYGAQANVVDIMRSGRGEGLSISPLRSPRRPVRQLTFRPLAHRAGDPQAVCHLAGRTDGMLGYGSRGRYRRGLAGRTNAGAASALLREGVGMTRLHCVHLIDDFAMDDLVNGLAIFDHPLVSAIARSSVRDVGPQGSLAPKLDADVIVTHFSPRWSSLGFALSLRLRNPHARIVHVEHSYTRAWEALKVRRTTRFRLLLRLAYALADEVVAVSQGQADWLTGIGAVAASKLSVINPWNDTSALAALPLPDFARDRPLRIGAIGRFVEAKGFDTLIEAMRRLHSTRFELILAGMGPQAGMLRARAEGLRHVSFIGRVDDVERFYGQCDIVVMPSRWEAFGQVAVEARRAGRPILVADVDGLSEQVGDAGMAADCSDARQLAEAISAMAKAPLSAMAAAARRSMVDAEAVVTSAWADLFRRAAQSAGSRARGGAIVSIAPDAAMA